MKLTFYGHSCFAIETHSLKLLVDPFITPNALASNIKVDEIEADFILLSHAHADHLYDCEAIALRTGATVIANYEVHEWLQKKGVTNTIPMNTGGSRNLGKFTVKCVVAQHSSGLPDGSYGGNPMGFLITIDGVSFYYSGDTALTMDMQLIPLWANVAFAVLPLGDHFTMGVDDAVRAAQFVQTKKVIGVHYDTFEWIRMDHALAKDKFNQQQIELCLPAIGASIEL